MVAGDRVGPYLLLQLLGRGGMGEVYAAVHERIGQEVALKLLTRLEPSRRARFLQEARALSQINHPGVVRILYLGQSDDGVPYLVMERVSGRPLREVLTGLPRERALWLGSRVADAMAAVHALGIVHRDLKPDNILVEADGVKIIDFGIAHVPVTPAPLLLDDTLIETSDEGPRWLGTAAYMAPEQCLRSATVGPAADVYALGVVLYEALCGHRPFEAADVVELAALHLHQPPDLSPPAFAGVRRRLGAMLAKDPAARPGMTQVAAGLCAEDEDDGDLSNRRQVMAGALILLIGAIAGLKKSVSPIQMRHAGLILIAHMEPGQLSVQEMRAALGPHAEESLLPVAVTQSGAAESGDFASAQHTLEEWFRGTLQPLLAQHPDHRLIYFGVAPIALILYLGWRVGTLRPVAVRLRHHGERRFLPWAATDGGPRMLAPVWHPSDGDGGEVAVWLSTSYPVNEAAARAAAPRVQWRVELALAEPGPDVFATEAAVTAAADAWRRLLDEIIGRVPHVRRIHLFASVQAGLAFLLGTRISPTMHPPIQTYQYSGGAFRPALVINQEQPPMAVFQTHFIKFHEKIKLKNTDENVELRQRRDEVLNQLRDHMWQRHRLRFQPFNSGSYAMGTGIQPQPGNDYDIDVGVVFALDHAKQDARELKLQVFGGLPTSLGRIEWRRPCITVFRKGHHVDVAVFVEDRGGLWLAMGKQTEPEITWQQDGIRLFIEDVKSRFANPGDEDQFQRTIRYLKRWKDVNFVGNGVKAPVGLALTVMAYYWFSPIRSGASYDDFKALRQLVTQTLDKLQAELPFPRAPKDNLLRKMSGEQVKQMRGRLAELQKLLEEAATKESVAPLRKAFGKDFPES